ncbi:MAG: hypothetical protein ACKV2T_01685 [Kofleriaceae bacterium]
MAATVHALRCAYDATDGEIEEVPDEANEGHREEAFVRDDEGHHEEAFVRDDEGHREEAFVRDVEGQREELDAIERAVEVDVNEGAFEVGCTENLEVDIDEGIEDDHSFQRKAGPDVSHIVECGAQRQRPRRKGDRHIRCL